MVEIDWKRIKEDHEVAYFRAEMCLDLPEGDYSIEEMQDIIQDMEMSTVEVDEALRLEFQSMPTEMQTKMLELLQTADSEHFDYWQRTLLGAINVYSQWPPFSMVS